MTPHPVVSMGDMNMFPSIIMFRGFVGNIVIYSSSSFDKLPKKPPTRWRDRGEKCFSKGWGLGS